MQKQLKSKETIQCRVDKSSVYYKIGSVRYILEIFK